MKGILTQVKKQIAYITSILTLILFTSNIIMAQKRTVTKTAANKTTAKRTTTTDPLVTLPASDALITVDPKRLINEAMPRALDESRRARVNKDIDDLKSKTGIDLRSVDRIAISLRAAYPTQGKVQAEGVAVASGGFNADEAIELSRNSSDSKPQEERYGGKVIYIYSIDQSISIPSWIASKGNQFAVVALDKDVIAIGELGRVRAAIDARAGRGRINADLIKLATQRANALIGMGGIVPPGLIENLDLGTDPISTAVSSIKQVYGSLASNATGFDLLVAARTSDAAQASRLHRTLTNMQRLSLMIRDAQLRKLVNNMQFSVEGNEVQIKLDIKEEDVPYLIEKIVK
jgi:hypothetical protein